MKVVFNEIIIIDKTQKKAKIQSFSNEINILTSSSGEGNYAGKSTLLKSLYHALGADLDFNKSKGWEDETKYYYVLSFYIDKNKYTVVRKDRFFKFYNESRQNIFSTENRDELSNFYSKFFNMTVLLKKSKDKKYSKAKPFSLFCLNYVGQEHYKGCSFSSFNNIGEYSDIRSDIILSHLGINDSEMNTLKEKITENQTLIEKSQNKELMLQSMISKIDSNKEFSYSLDTIEELKYKIKLHEDEYNKIMLESQKLKEKIYSLHNTKVLLLNYIEKILKQEKSIESNEKILRNHKCPLCENEIENYNEVFFKKVKIFDELPIQLLDSEALLSELDRKIENQMEEYKKQELKMSNIENTILENNNSIENVVSSIGLKKYKTKLITELNELNLKILELDKEIKDNNSKIKKLNKRILNINSRYREILLDMKTKYSINIFDVSPKITIKSKIQCGDSHVITTLWLCALNKLKFEFNSSGTFFPLVFDNPTDRDFDEKNMEIVQKMIFDQIPNPSQIIISKLKFDYFSFEGYENINEITLNNSKFQLLNSNDYDKAIIKLTDLMHNS